MSGARATFGGPLRFVPVYKTLVWGGRRMQAFRPDLPAGPIGESWDLSDHTDGMSVVADGPHAGRTLAELVAAAGPAIVGAGFAGGPFPLMVKLIDAAQNLSVQVHPDDVLARQLGVGANGKTECWRVLADGGTIFQGTRAGVDRAAFEQALASGTVAQTLNNYAARAGDCFFIPARTVHALGAGCLVYEVQQTSNLTFRVDDWGRVGLDGKPRPLHVRESLATIDFSAPAAFGPLGSAFVPDASGGQTRVLADCPHFRLRERRGHLLAAPAADHCSIVIGLHGSAVLATAGAAVELAAAQTVLVPAAAGAWSLQSHDSEDLVVLVAEPRC